MSQAPETIVPISRFSAMAYEREATMTRQRFQLSSPRHEAVPPPIADGRRLYPDHKTGLPATYNDEPAASLPADDDRHLQNGSQPPASPKADPPPLKRNLSKGERRHQGAQNGDTMLSHISEQRRADEERSYQLETPNGDSQPLPIMNNRRVTETSHFPPIDQNGRGVVSPNGDHSRFNEERSYFEGYTDNMSVSKASAVSDASSKFADFFGAGVFQIVLHNPTTAHQLKKFSQARFCGENMEFLEKVDKYESLLNDMLTTMTDIHRNFISPNAPTQINLSEAALKTVHVGMKTSITSTLPAMESIFVEAQDKIENLVYTDIYPRFVRYQMTMSATRALAGDRTKFQGLGDCFCLTNPSKADNPIVYASDGFVKVTGYTRQEIIPRNCRFLQGQHTDRVPVRRLRTAIDANEESVELLLNYKKNGDPFWNLLFVAPLYNADGNVAFFIGGQINCSTTIHSNSDVLRILATSNEEQDEKQPDTVLPRNQSTFGRKGILKAFRSHSSSNRNLPTVREAGMEQGLLNRIEKYDLKTQMNAFYTAYSKYIVVRYDSFVVRFYSAGIAEMLSPTNPANSQIVGSDVFKFLGANASSNTKDYKSRVKSALREGLPISLDIRLETRRSMVFRGEERFVSHWTPVKDESARIGYVVITMGSAVSQS